MTATQVGPKITARGARRGREQRVMPKTLARAIGDTDGDALRVSGYACVTGQPYRICDMFGEYTEVVDRGAFTDAIARSDDVRFLVDHEGSCYARTKYETLTLREVLDPASDPLGEGTTGLWIEALMDGGNTGAADRYREIKRGDIDQMSFAFQVTEQEWSPDYSQRNIRSVKLFDVSAVHFPANDATTIVARDLDALVEQLSDDDARDVYARLGHRFAANGRRRTPNLARAQLHGLGFEVTQH